MKLVRSEMRIYQSIVVCGLCCLFLCSSAVPLSGSMTNMHPLVRGTVQARDGGMDIPTWYQGDEWTYTIDPLYYSGPNGSFTGTIQNLRQQVVGIVGDAYQVTITGDISGTLVMNGITGTVSGGITGTSYMRVSDLAQETTALQSQGTILVIVIPLPYTLDLTMNSSPPLELFDFPVNAGEQWEFQGLSTTTGLFNVQGVFQQSLNGSQWVDEVMSCLAEESVNVPAGAFDCMKVSHGSTMVWYSSEAGNIVKSVIDQSGGNTTVQMTQSLMSFSRAAQPLTVSENIVPSVTIPGALVVVSGQATHTGSGAPVQNGAVTVTIPSLGLSWNTTTDAGGNYSVSFGAPVIHDDTPSGRETGSGGVIALCSSGGLSGYRVHSLVTIQNSPPGTPIIAGPAKGRARVAYNYTFTSMDAEGDSFLLYADWGDNTTSGWIGLYTPGVPGTLSHTFEEKGTYSTGAKKQRHSYNEKRRRKKSVHWNI